MTFDTPAVPLNAPLHVSRRRGRWVWLLLPMLLGIGVLLWILAQSIDPSQIHVRIGDDDAWVYGDNDAQISTLGALFALLIAALVLAVVLPVTLVMVVGAVLLALLLGLGLPVLLLITVVGVLLSPFLLIGWLLWKLLT